MKFKGRDAVKIASLSYARFFQSLLPSVGKSYAKSVVKWQGASTYFTGMSDPFKTFEVRLPNGQVASKSTAELLKIQKGALDQSRNQLRSVLEGLKRNEIVSSSNPWLDPRGYAIPQGYSHLATPDKLLTEYPFRNDVYQHDPLRKVEGLAVPNSVESLWVTHKVFNRSQFSDEAMTSAMVEILTCVKLIHNACNANAMMSPSVHIALNRLGFTDTMFARLDAQASEPVVPKRSGIPVREANRGAWSDNRFFGDPRYGAQYSYSNKNLYLPALGNLDQTSVPDVYRDGPQGEISTKFVNPCFPEWFRPIHFASLAPSGSSPDAGFMIEGNASEIYRMSLRNRGAVFSFSDVSRIGPSELMMGDPINYREPFLNNLSGAVYLSYFTGVDGSGRDRNARRLRDWYLTSKPKCDIRMADAVTDFATIVQLGNFILNVPPHVLLHSVMGFHNALLKLSFEYVGVPYSTNITEYQTKMRIEREGILNLSRNPALENLSGSSELGFALTVKPQDDSVLENAQLRDITVATLQTAMGAAIANPVAGVVCFALVGLAVLIAEITGGNAQPLITPRDRSREDLRDKPNGGIRCNWFRGYTPEMIINTIPVLGT